MEGSLGLKIPTMGTEDQLPSNLDFNAPPVSEATRLSGSLIPVEQDP